MVSLLSDVFALAADIVLPFQGIPEVVGNCSWVRSFQKCSRNTRCFVSPCLRMTQAPAVARVGQRAVLFPGKIYHAVKSHANHTYSCVVACLGVRSAQRGGLFLNMLCSPSHLHAMYYFKQRLQLCIE